MKYISLRRDRWTVTLFLCVGMMVHANAQTFTERVQKKVEGKGTLTIHQSKDIEQLVNDPQATEVQQPQKPNDNKNKPNDNKKQTEHSKDKGQTNKEIAQTGETKTEDDALNTTTTTVANTHKVMGYRVQAFAGGNSRKDRQMAEQIRNDIKSHFANVPVYVHFYSPRWICRVGNYRTYEEAHQMMVNLQKLGYKQASIVKGKITVQY